MDSEGTRDRPGAEFLAEQLALVPPRYSPITHLASTASIGLLAWVVAWISIDDFRWALLPVAVGFLVLANFVEWWAHKYLLHHRRRFFEILYDQHTPRHHIFYRHDRMAVSSRREWYFVLMPRRGVLGIALLAIPLALAVGALFGPDFGWVAVMTVGSYASLYEVSHLCYHLPPTHPVQRLGVIRFLSRHHARHHHVRLMQKWNFNVTIPLADYVLRTHYPRAKPLPEP